MGYWLARERGGQESAPMMRFDPAYWTVNFPRPSMAAITTAAPDAMRVDCTFHHSNELVGLIWESEDRWDHPLLRYETRRDYRHCRLRFRWRSSGLMPLDAINGPTLTIEGRDVQGQARSWYVRLWNYAQGSAQDADIDLDFDDLDGGFLLPGEADPVYAADIDRMFISLIPPQYDGAGTAFANAVEAWVELSDMRCSGSGAIIDIGDVMVPEHGWRIANGYDDCYNQTPARVLRQMLALGYRGDILHYVGMSHYFRLEANSGGWYASLNGGVLNAPCAAWHADFAARAKALGFGVIWSLSYELFDAHCWNDWKQRAENGDPALTGWTPPSTLLSPAHEGAMAYLRAVARAFVAIGADAGLTPRFQVGEPWWWIMADGRICLYDDAARAALGGAPVAIPDLRGPLDASQKDLLDAAGALLSASTAGLCDAVRQEAPDCVTYLLAYLPTILAPDMPEARRANLPVGWAVPAFDVLQLEDYDWVTQGCSARTQPAIEAVTARLGYPVAGQHYLSGFVLSAMDAAAQWPLIHDAALASRRRGADATYFWALPQIARDGFTPFEIAGEAQMQPFDDVNFPIAIGREASVTPVFSTQVIESLSGHEQRNNDWADARLRFDAGPGLRSDQDLAVLIAFFRARRGAARGFRFTDPYDHLSCVQTRTPSPDDQPLGLGDGVTSRFRLRKFYGEAGQAQERIITRPVAESIRIAADGDELLTGWQYEEGGWIAFDTPPASGAFLTAGFAFDVPVRFEQDSLEINRATFAAGEAPSVPLVEIRE